MYPKSKTDLKIKTDLNFRFPQGLIGYIDYCCYKSNNLIKVFNQSFHKYLVDEVRQEEGSSSKPEIERNPLVPQMVHSVGLESVKPFTVVLLTY